MHQILSRLEKEFPFLGRRAASETDFFECCDRAGIEVVFTPEISSGIYVRFQGRNFIFLGTGLSGWQLLYVMFHELAHAIFHAPSQFGVECFDGFLQRKNHEEAESAAALLLFPLHELEPIDQDKTALASRRMDLFYKFGI